MNIGKLLLNPDLFTSTSPSTNSTQSFFSTKLQSPTNHGTMNNKFISPTSETEGINGNECTPSKSENRAFSFKEAFEKADLKSFSQAATPKKPADTSIVENSPGVLSRGNINRKKNLSQGLSITSMANLLNHFEIQSPLSTTPATRSQKRLPLIIQIPVKMKPQRDPYEILEDLEFNGIVGNYDAVSRPQTAKNNPKVINIDLERRREYVCLVYKNLYKMNTEIEKVIQSYKNYAHSKQKINYNLMDGSKKGELYLEGVMAEEYREKVLQLLQKSSNQINENKNPLSKPMRPATAFKATKDQRNSQSATPKKNIKIQFVSQAQSEQESSEAKKVNESQQNSSMGSCTSSGKLVIDSPMWKTSNGSNLDGQGSLIMNVAKKYLTNLTIETSEPAALNLLHSSITQGVYIRKRNRNTSAKKPIKLLSTHIGGAPRSSASVDRDQSSEKQLPKVQWEHLAQIDKVSAMFHKRYNQAKQRPLTLTKQQKSNSIGQTQLRGQFHIHKTLVRDLTSLN